MARPDRSSKGRRGYKNRNVNSREERQRFLIVCEGSKTEPNYFKGFRVDVREIIVKGLGISPSQLVDEADLLRQEKGYDQVWCVFDRDSWPIDNFNGAFSKARAKGIKVAYTNEAFELWYLLHFNYHDTAIGREAYKAKLTANLGVTYVKKDPDTIFALFRYHHWYKFDPTLSNTRGRIKKCKDSNPDMYSKLKTKMTIAIQNAKRLLTQYQQPNPAEDNPSTTVHLLVEELLRFSR